MMVAVTRVKPSLEAWNSVTNEKSDVCRVICRVEQG